MIVRPENMNFKDQNFAMILYGQPGIGKSTLAASAPNPVLIDFDNGVSRIRAEHRPATSISSTYEEVLADIQNMKEFDTIIIDTGGSFVTYLKDWAFRTQSGCKTKTGELFNCYVQFDAAARQVVSCHPGWLKEAQKTGTDLGLGNQKGQEQKPAVEEEHKVKSGPKLK